MGPHGEIAEQTPELSPGGGGGWVGGRADQDQRRDQIRAAQRYIDGDLAAERVAEQGDRCGVQRVEQGGDEVGVPADVEDGGRLVGQSKPARSGT